MYAWNWFDDYGAFVFFAFDDGFGCGFAFYGEYVLGVWNEHVSVAVFALQEVSYPSAYALATYVFHGHAAYSGEDEN